ncbi:MAG: polysaccharide deacetylase family protein [Cyclobacteriaceae bacterium]
MKKLLGLALIGCWTQLVAQTPIAITIDDFPLISLDKSAVNQTYVVEQLISHSKRFSVPAIVFVNESKLYVDSELNEFKLSMLQEWAENGLELGNHGYAHLNYSRTDTTTYFADLIKGEIHSKRISESNGLIYQYYRHPYLHAGETAEKEIALERFLVRNGYEEAPVTIDNSDWIYSRAYDLARKEDNQTLMDSIGTSYVQYMLDKTEYFQLKSRELLGRDVKQILLLHTNNINADYLDDLLAALLERGNSFVTISEALQDPAYQLNDHIAKPWGISWVHRWSRNMEVDKSFYRGEPPCPKWIREYSGLSE